LGVDRCLRRDVNVKGRGTVAFLFRAARLSASALMLSTSWFGMFSFERAFEDAVPYRCERSRRTLESEELFFMLELPWPLRYLPERLLLFRAALVPVVERPLLLLVLGLLELLL
jgi:hypothetical protein